MTKTTLRDIYWDKYGVGGMALRLCRMACQKKITKNFTKWH